MPSPSSPPQQHPECKTAGTKRKRIVQGSCWPCKQRRVKCDLRKPSCDKCHSLGAECCYDRLLLRWSTNATKGGGRGPLLQTPFNRRFGSSFGDEWAALATNDQKALDYFRVRLLALALHHRYAIRATRLHRIVLSSGSPRGMHLRRSTSCSPWKGTVG